LSILDKVKANPIGTANTVYLIFPILSLTVLGYKGPLWGGIFVTILFILSYLIMIYEDLTEKVKLRRVLLLIHFLGIIYFVAFFHAFDIMFFFYGAFIIPYAFQVKLNSIEVLMYFIAFSLSLTIVVLDYKDYLFILSPMSIVFILLLLGNFKAIEADKLKEEINSKNEHINILIAEQERNRIGQDLHDTLGHVFASLSIKSELAMKLADNDIEQAKEEMASVNELSKEALVKVRAIVDDLKLQSFEEEVETMDTLLKNANLSLHYFDMEKTKEIFDEIYEVLEKGGLFIGRMNSDKNAYVNDNYIEMEKDFYYDPIKEQHKRLFNQEQFDILTKQWNIVVLNESVTTRKRRKKYTWEFILQK